jgi:pimeloyl-ACP methyl ester carboxylesterase
LRKRFAIASCLLVFPLACAANQLNGQVPAKQPPVRASSQASEQARPAGVAGEWEGALQVGEAQLRLVLHLSGQKAGELHARLDSPDQAVYGLEATSAIHEQSNLRFEVASVGAFFEGKVSADGRTISGTWKQSGSVFPLVFHRQSASAAGRRPANAISPLEGTWQGAFENGNMRFRLQLHVAHDAGKNLSGTLDSLDQGANDLPVTKMSEKNGAVHFEIALVSGSYDGTLNAARNAISGKWTQNQDTVALDFTRSDEVLELHRPQNPAKPYPYKEEEVHFTTQKGSATLAGTLTLPQGTGPFPVALLVAGSGPQNRDESLAGHSLFLVLADHLTRNGIAVLRYDKRGIGKSTGDFGAATTEDFAADAEMALAYLKSRKEITPGKIGAIGHSEGALIAPILAGKGGVAWIVLLAGPAQTGEKTMLAQSRAIALAAGMPEAQVLQSLVFDRKAYATVREEKDPVLLEKKLDAMVISSGMTESAVPASVQAQIHMLSSPWFRYFLDYDPLPALQTVKCPVLALNGEKDLQVISKDNLPLIQKTLDDSGNKDATTKELPELNHLFQHAGSGTPAEYGAIQETISPEVLQLIADWIAKHNAS